MGVIKRESPHCKMRFSITRNSPAVQHDHLSKIFSRIFTVNIGCSLRNMCRKTQDSSKQSLLERFWNQRRLCSRNTTTTSLPNEQTPSLAFSSSSTLQGTVDVCLLLARLSSTGGSSLSATVDSGTPDSNREENESLAIERVVEQWLGSVRQRWHQN